MAHYVVLLYSTAPETQCPNGEKHLLEALIYNLDAPRREDAMKRRSASYIAAMARNGDTFSINMLEEDTPAQRVPVAFPQCACCRGYHLNPWSPHYERPDESLF